MYQSCCQLGLQSGDVQGGGVGVGVGLGQGESTPKHSPIIMGMSQFFVGPEASLFHPTGLSRGIWSVLRTWQQALPQISDH